MKTRLYNKNIEEFISKTFEGGYKVDGKKPELPDHIVELEIIVQDIPELNPETHRIERHTEIDLDTKQYITAWQVIELSDYEKAMRQWEGENLELRIKAPIDLILGDFGVKVKGWFDFRGLPVIVKGEVVHLYCNEIQPQFEETVDQLVNDGIIEIENKPSPQDFENKNNNK